MCVQISLYDALNFEGVLVTSPCDVHHCTAFAVIAHDNLLLLEGIGDVGDFSKGQMGPIGACLEDNFLEVGLVKRPTLGAHQNFPVSGLDDSAGQVDG